MAEFKKGDKLKYLGEIPYILGDEQKVDQNVKEVTILRDLELNENLFKLVEPELDLDPIHQKALIENQVFDANKKKENGKKG